MTRNTNCLSHLYVSRVLLKQKHVPEWKPEIRVPSLSEHTTLNGLAWNTEYEVHVVAENQQGRSEPGIVSIKTAAQPTAIPGTTPIVPPQHPHTHTQQLQSTQASTMTRQQRSITSYSEISVEC